MINNKKYSICLTSQFYYFLLVFITVKSTFAAQANNDDESITCILLIQKHLWGWPIKINKNTTLKEMKASEEYQNMLSKAPFNFYNKKDLKYLRFISNSSMPNKNNKLLDEDDIIANFLRSDYPEMEPLKVEVPDEIEMSKFFCIKFSEKIMKIGYENKIPISFIKTQLNQIYSDLPAAYTLTFRGKTLQDEQTLESLGVKEQDTLLLVEESDKAEEIISTPTLDQNKKLDPLQDNAQKKNNGTQSTFFILIPIGLVVIFLLCKIFFSHKSRKRKFTRPRKIKYMKK